MILVTLIWSSNGLLIKLVAWSPMSISGLRSLFPALVLLPFLGKPRHLVSFDTLMGGLGFAGALTTFVIATKLTTAANAIFLQLTAPVYVALLSGWLLGERVRVLDWVITGIILSGMLLFFGDNLTVDGFWGNICAIISAICWAIFVLFSCGGIGVQRRQVVFTQYTGSILEPVSSPDLTLEVLSDSRQDCVSCGFGLVEDTAGDGGIIFPSPLPELGVCQRLKAITLSKI